MTDQIRLKEDYTIAKCCNPTQSDEIIGYYSHTNVLKVHCTSCANLAKAEPDRLVKLEWDEILAVDETIDTSEVSAKLDKLDYAILSHHAEYGVDYSHKVARMLGQEKQTLFDRHHKLRDLMLLERVEPRMIRYRKGIVDNKWIKHRNHTYYDLTILGRACLDNRP